MNDALREVAGPFLRLGFTALGGPAAHIVLMREEVVRLCSGVMVLLAALALVFVPGVIFLR